MSRSLLAHVVSKFAPSQWENVATEALEYLLKRRGADGAVAQLLAPVSFTPGPLVWRTQVSTTEDSSRPDLVGQDDRHRGKLIIEVKFWAALTDNQPLGYLDRQAAQFPVTPNDHLLVFLVPKRRLSLITAEIQKRLGVTAQTVTGDHLLFNRDGRRVLVVPWSQMLSQLQTALHSAGDDAGLDDLVQLRGLCDRADDEAMLPLAAEEIDAGRGQRFFEFCELVDRAADQLLRDGSVDSKGLRSAAGKGWYCRYLRHTASGHVFGLGVYAWSWGNTYPSPWWVKFYDSDPSVDRALERLEGHPLLPHIARRDLRTEVALYPPIGVEEHEAAQIMADAVRVVCTALPVADSPSGAISKDAQTSDILDREL